MEDQYPHHLFRVSENPSMDEVFSAERHIAMTDLPPAVDDDNAGEQFALPGANSGDVDFQEDYSALWLMLCDDVLPRTASVEEAASSGTHDDRQELDKDLRLYYLPENMEIQPPRSNEDHDRNLIMPLQILPANPVPFDCSFCQVLREIIHVHYEYNLYMKLEIHGRLGAIFHAILERKLANVVNSTPGDDSQFEILDLCSKSTEEVKQFLTSYCLQRSEEGYVMSDDPLSTFYEALSVGISTSAIRHSRDIVSGVSGESGPQNSEEIEDQRNQDKEEEQDKKQANQPTSRRRRRNSDKISLAAQRKRTARLTLRDLREVFHLALVEASKRMEVCSTVLKKICRRDGVNRWPYRKLDSVKKKIADLREDLNSSDAATRAEAEEKIDALRREAIKACGGISIL